MADYNGDLKLLNHKIDAQTKKIDKIDGKMDGVCDAVSRYDERIKTNSEEIKSLRKKSDAWNAGNTLGVMVAYVLSIFGINEG